jgi:hypothetical protein
MTIDALEPERNTATSRDDVWRRLFTQRIQTERHRMERDAVHVMMDSIPYGLRAEYYRRRRERLRKYFEDE